MFRVKFFVMLQVTVRTTMDLQKIEEINEIDSIFRVQFVLRVMWYDARFTYNNLKTETAMNVLKSEQQSEIWLPLVIFYNTDQKETTRLGMQNEWSTEVNVVRKAILLSLNHSIFQNVIWCTKFF